MSQATIKCPYCPVKSYSNRILGHILSHHQEDFFSDKKYQLQLSVLSKNSKKLGEFDIHRDGGSVHCCFGCNSTFKRDKCAEKHMKEKDCIERHSKFIIDKIVPIAVKVKDLSGSSVSSDPKILEKLSILEKQNMTLQNQIQTLKQRLKDTDECHQEELDKRMAFQDIVDDELTPQMREIFKRILYRKSPEVFKEIYDATQYEVSVSESDDDSESESESEENEETEEREEGKREEETLPVPPKFPPIYSGRQQTKYKVFHHGDEVIFTDDTGVLYDKITRGQTIEYVRCGALINGKVEFD